jgi:hypothetical protein
MSLKLIRDSSFCLKRRSVQTSIDPLDATTLAFTLTVPGIKDSISLILSAKRFSSLFLVFSLTFWSFTFSGFLKGGK